MTDAAESRTDSGDAAAERASAFVASVVAFLQAQADDNEMPASSVLNYATVMKWWLGKRIRTGR